MALNDPIQGIISTSKTHISSGRVVRVQVKTLS